MTTETSLPDLLLFLWDGKQKAWTAPEQPNDHEHPLALENRVQPAGMYALEYRNGLYVVRGMIKQPHVDESVLRDWNNEGYEVFVRYRKAHRDESPNPRVKVMERFSRPGKYDFYTESHMRLSAFLDKHWPLSFDLLIPTSKRNNYQRIQGQSYGGSHLCGRILEPLHGDEKEFTGWLTL